MSEIPSSTGCLKGAFSARRGGEASELLWRRLGGEASGLSCLILLAGEASGLSCLAFLGGEASGLSCLTLLGGEASGLSCLL